VRTKAFLQKLSAPFVGVVPFEVMVEADALLQHFPTLAEIEIAHKANPDIFGPVPPFQRSIPNPEIQGIIDATKRTKND